MRARSFSSQVLALVLASLAAGAALPAEKKDAKEAKDQKKKDGKKDGKKGEKKPKEKPLRKPSAGPRVILNEILYHPQPNESGREFIEIHNPLAVPADLSGWSLADEVTYAFPAGTRIAPGGYLVVGGDPKLLGDLYRIPGILGPWKGQLDNKGGTVSLLDAKGDLVEEVTYDNKPPFPLEAAGEGPSLERIHPGFKEAWHWRPGAVRPEWFRVERNGYISGDRLIFYLTGEGSCLIDDVRVTPRSAPEPNAVRNPSFEGGLAGWESSGNHTAFVQAGDGKDGKSCLKIAARGPGFGTIHSVSAKLEGIPKSKLVTLSFWAKGERGALSLVARFEGEGLVTEEEMHLVGGSPGGPNRVRAADLDPWIQAVWHEPERPLPGQPVTVLARVRDDEAVASVTLEYGDFDAEDAPPREIPMADCGALANGARAFAAAIPPLPDGAVVTYRVKAVDAAGRPAPPEAQKAFYVGKPFLPGRAVPSFALLISPSAMDSLERAKTSWVPGIVVFDGKVYDRVQVRHRGHSSIGFPKRHFKIRFDGEKFEGARTVNLSASWADKSYLREPLAYAVFAESGVPSWEVKGHARLYVNGKYWGLFYRLEQPGRDSLKRNGLDPEGELFKCYAKGMPSPTGSYAPGDYQDMTSNVPRYDVLHEFLSSMHLLDGAELKKYIQKHVNVDEFVSYLAATALVMNSDHVGKNYFLYRDPSTGKWSMLPWDLDLTFGRNYECGNPSPLLNDVLRWDNPILFGTDEHPKCDIGGNRIITKFLSLPENRTLLYQRVGQLLKNFARSRMDRLIKPLYTRIKDEVKLDRSRWQAYGPPASWDFDKQVLEIQKFIDERGKFLARELQSAKAPPRGGR